MKFKVEINFALDFLYVFPSKNGGWIRLFLPPCTKVFYR